MNRMLPRVSDPECLFRQGLHFRIHLAAAPQCVDLQVQYGGDLDRFGAELPGGTIQHPVRHCDGVGVFSGFDGRFQSLQFALAPGSMNRPTRHPDKGDNE
jgi:hypothetical protein